MKIIKDPFLGFYASVKGHLLTKLEIQYFQAQFGKWVLKDGDLDSRVEGDLNIVTAEMD